MICPPASQPSIGIDMSLKRHYVCVREARFKLTSSWAAEVIYLSRFPIQPQEQAFLGLPHIVRNRIQWVYAPFRLRSLYSSHHVSIRRTCSIGRCLAVNSRISSEIMQFVGLASA